MKTLDFATYEANAMLDPQWKSYRERWAYHEAAIGIVNALNLSRPKRVLEIGAFGAGIVIGSDRMDLPDGSWNLPGDIRTILHDARDIPWPIADNRYDLLIALRVWHHLAPVQESCFTEAKRIAKNIIIACPEQEVVGIGIKRDRFIAWNGAPPLKECDFGTWGKLYWFGDVNA